MNEVPKESTLTYTDKNGKKTKCTILFEIDMKDKNYLIYTDNTTDENGQIRTYASSYVPGNSELLSIETESEWKMIENFMTSVIEKNVKE